MEDARIKTAKEILTEEMRRTCKMVGARIRQVRDMYKMSQRQLAKHSGINHKMIYEFESGRRRPNLEHLVRLSLVLNTDLREFFVPLPEDPFAVGGE